MAASIPKLLESRTDRGPKLSHETLPWCWAGAEQHSTAEGYATWTAEALYKPSVPCPLSHKGSMPSLATSCPCVITWELGTGRKWGWKHTGCRLS